MGYKTGDSNIITREYLDALLIELRQVGCVIPDTRLKLFGEEFSTPVMTAAFSHVGHLREKGMAEMAQGAVDARAVMWYGMGDEKELESITATGARTIKIIKPYGDRERIFSQLAHAKQCGALAVGMDIDHSFSSHGAYDVVDGNEMTGMDVADISSFVKATDLPFIVKGVLSVRDALLCAKAGVQGIVVSHHHGIIDYAVPPLQILPKIREAAGNEIKIFADCGIASGADVFKALALGADAVSVGRYLLEPYKEQGAKGVSETIRRMTEELAGVMAHTDSPDLLSIDPSVIWHRV